MKAPKKTPTGIVKYKIIINQVSSGCWRLGAVVGPSGIKRNRRKIVEELARDLDPASREAVKKVYENWKGEESEKELRRILGKRLTKKFLREAKS